MLLGNEDFEQVGIETVHGGELVGGDVLQQAIHELASFRVLLKRGQVDSGDEHGAIADLGFHQDSEFMVTLEVVDHLTDGMIVVRGLI